MKYSELITKTESELNDLAFNLKKTLYSLRVQKKFNQLSSTSQIRINRRDLARIFMRLSDIKKKERRS